MSSGSEHQDDSSLPLLSASSNLVEVRAEAVVPAFDRRRLTLARERSGLTKRALASQLGVTPAAVTQFEKGQTRPSGKTLELAARILGLPVSYFASGRPLFPMHEQAAHFRSLRATRSWERSQALAAMSHVIELVRVLEKVVRFPEVAVPSMPTAGPSLHTFAPEGADALLDEAAATSESVTAQSAAREVRARWSIQPGPLRHLVRVLEAHGVVVAVARFGSSERIDAFSCWSALDRPIICLSRDRGNVLRRRFNAAHELGHLVMHQSARPGDVRHEREADQFAAELLMPAAEIEPLLPARPDLAYLLELQRAWGVSVQALLYRSHGLGVMQPASYRRGMVMLSELGWQRREPTDEYPGEWPTMLTEAEALSAGQGLTDVILAAGLQLPLNELRELLGRPEDMRPELHLVVPPNDEQMTLPDERHT